MGLQYPNLDAKSRAHMQSEFQSDQAAGRLYMSSRLSAAGVRGWPALLSEAIASHDDDWLAAEIQRRGFLNSHEERKKPTGGVTVAKIPSNAHEVMAEGEFNRFYVRGLCLRAMEENVPHVVVHRARHSENPRRESEALIGKAFAPAALLSDLRKSPGVDPALGVPPGPNSGLSVRLP